VGSNEPLRGDGATPQDVVSVERWQEAEKAFDRR